MPAAKRLGGTLPAVFQEEDVGAGKGRIIDPADSIHRDAQGDRRGV